MLAVFVECGGTDTAELTSCQRRLEEVRGVGAPFGGPGTNHRVQLVDEEDHAPSRSLHFSQDRLEPILKLTAILGARNQSAEIEGDDPLITKCFRNIRLHDPQREPLGDRRFSHARLPDQHRVVLGPPREHLDHATDLRVTANHRIELALAGSLHEVDSVFLKRLELLFWVLVGDPRTASHRLESGEQLLFVNSAKLQDVLRFRWGLHQRQQEVVGGDKLIFHHLSFFGGLLEDLHQLRIRLGLGASGNLRLMGKFRLGDSLKVTAVDANFLQQRPDDSFVLGYQGLQKVDRRDLRIATVCSGIDGTLHRFLSFNCELVEAECHGSPPLLQNTQSKKKPPCPEPCSDSRRLLGRGILLVLLDLKLSVDGVVGRLLFRPCRLGSVTACLCG